ncbi:DUF4340 domain-containing protein [Myxococcota bacterium]
MTYRTRTLIKAALGLLFVTILSLAVYFGVYKVKEGEARADSEAREVLRFDQEKVIRLLLEKGGKRTIVERTGRDGKNLPVWKLVEPVKDDGDNTSINSLLGVVDRLESEQVIAGKDREPLSVYGLDPPRGKIVLTLEGDQSHTLHVGKKSAFDNRLYIQRAGDEEILLVKGYVENSLLKKTFDLRRKELVSFEKGLVRRLVLTSAGVKIALEKEGETWNITAPLDDRADKSEVDKILNTVLNLRATAFPLGEKLGLEVYGLQPPAVTLEVFIGPDLARSAVVLGRGQLKPNQGKTFARLQPSGPVAEVREYQLKNLQKTPFDLQAKAPLGFESKEVFKIKSASDQSLIVLEKEEVLPAGKGRQPRKTEVWSLVSPRAAKAKNHRVVSFLSGLSGLRAVRFVGDKQKADLGVFGLDKPVRTITLYDREDRELGVLKIGKSTPEGIYVIGTARPQVCLVDSKKVEHFPIDVKDLEADKQKKLDRTGFSP